MPPTTGVAVAVVFQVIGHDRWEPEERSSLPADRGGDDFQGHQTHNVNRVTRVAYSESHVCVEAQRSLRCIT
jgi:hypothetical protein